MLELGFGDGGTLLHYHPDAEAVAVEKKHKWVVLAEKMVENGRSRQ